MKEKIEQLLNTLGEKLDMELDFAGDDEIDLDIGGELTLNLRKDEDNGTLSLAAVVAEELPDALEPAMMIELMDLALNPLVSGAPAIGRESESGMMIAYVTLPVMTVSPVDFPEMVNAFLDFALVWKTKFRDMPLGGEDSSIRRFVDSSIEGTGTEADAFAAIKA